LKQYFAIATNSDPTAVLFGQFYAANMFSMVLYIGNPTNIIVAQVCVCEPE
jgi:Na+/H+ antiporter NhaD/arsenite permease-like protein